jgi:thiol-disulfide isomerase/thioredoxin
MGKASRTKRERRDGEGTGSDGGTTLPRIDVPAERRQLPIFWMVIGALVLVGIVVLVLTAPDDAAKEREAAAADAPVYADVEVSGDELPTWNGTGEDDGIGETVPTISGTNLDGDRTTIPSGDGTARAYVVMAHWCPHCQAEIPRIVEWSAENDLPAGVEIVGVSTSVDDGNPNFPPATWLAREDWQFETLADDELGTAAQALGVEGFPYMVFVDGDGKVVQRFSGEMPMDEFADAIDEIAPAEAAGTAGQSTAPAEG